MLLYIAREMYVNMTAVVLVEVGVVGVVHGAGGRQLGQGDVRRRRRGLADHLNKEGNVVIK